MTFVLIVIKQQKEGEWGQKVRAVLVVRAQQLVLVEKGGRVHVQKNFAQKRISCQAAKNKVRLINHRHLCYGSRLTVRGDSAREYISTV